jgi:pimeloyl-ACP methyl ester carboxylesterase
MKRMIKLAMVLLIFFISIVSAKFVAKSQAIVSEDIAFDQEWATDQVIEKNIIVKAGVTLRITKGVTLTFKNGEMGVEGTVVFSGTAKEPITLKKDSNARAYSINVNSGGNLIMRNVDMSGAGPSMLLLRSNFFVPTANAFARGGIHVNGGSLNAQSCFFHDNERVIAIENSSSGKVVVNRSKFFHNSNMDVIFSGYLPENAVDFAYNWWGAPTGPAKTCEIVDGKETCYFDQLAGNIIVSPWLNAETFHDPVVILPGVFGSQQEKGVWKIDPIFHVYDNLVDAFEASGYVVGKDLFVFPYEWRDSNAENAIKLRYKIAEIKRIANWPKVDVVAHSMGGLLARQYIESNAYQNDIDQLITLGTPNKGSPEIYPFWEAGKAIGVVQTGMRRFLEQERKEGGYLDLFEYIRSRPIASAGELLPNYEYLYDVDTKSPLIYPVDYPINTFLDTLNEKEKIQKLNMVEHTKIVGNVASDKSTISGFNVVRVDMGKLWQHGYPLSFEIPIIGDRGVINGYGDGTVPISSAKSENVPADNYLEFPFLHSDLPTKAQKDILEILLGNRPSAEIAAGPIKNMLQILVHSPVDVQIISPSGKIFGKDLVGNKDLESIGGSFYSGMDTINEFVTIPNPEEGVYTILAQGTGDGQYELEVVKTFQDSLDENAVSEAEVLLGGTAIKNQVQKFAVQVASTTIMQVVKKDDEEESEIQGDEKERYEKSKKENREKNKMHHKNHQVRKHD